MGDATEATEDETQEQTLQLVRIWPDEYTDKPKTRNVLVASLYNPKDIPTVMSVLKDLFPLPELRHLKRVRRTATPASSSSTSDDTAAEQATAEIILAWADGVSAAVDGTVLLSSLFDGKCTSLLPFLRPPLRVHEVCTTSRLLTQEQWSLSHQKWPTVRPNPLVSLDVRDNSSSASSSHQLHRRFLKDLGKHSASPGTDCLRNRVIMIDPVKQIAVYRYGQSGAVSSSFNPLHHPVMLAIDYIASLQLNKPGEKRSAEQLKDVGTAEDASSYLCTGYYAYLSLEPCLMCSMALVHARIRCVIFRDENPNEGALKSLFKLQGLKSLNHHFEVWQAVLSKIIPV